MSKEFICKGCGEKFNKDMQSSNVGYCYICNEFYMQKQVSDLEAKLAESEKDKLMWQEMYKSADRLNKGICETDIYPLQEENTQLKQQLAETKTRIAELEDKDWYEGTIKQLEEQNEKLLNKLAEKDKNNLILYSMLYETLEKQGCENVASQIDQMTGMILDKQADWFKGNRNCAELLKLLAEKEQQIETQKSNIEFLYDLFVSPQGEQTLKTINQNKISFAVEQLEKVLKHFVYCGNEIVSDYCLDCEVDELKEEIDNQIEELTHQHEDKGEKK